MLGHVSRPGKMACWRTGSAAGCWSVGRTAVGRTAEGTRSCSAAAAAAADCAVDAETAEDGDVD